jgi:hypothetical protein
LVAMGTAQLFPTPGPCQWRGARVRGYCRTAAICRGRGQNNAPLLCRGPRGQEVPVARLGRGGRPRTSSLLAGAGRWGAGDPGLCGLHALRPPPSALARQREAFPDAFPGPPLRWTNPLIPQHSCLHLSFRPTPFGCLLQCHLLCSPPQVWPSLQSCAFKKPLRRPSPPLSPLVASYLCCKGDCSLLFASFSSTLPFPLSYQNLLSIL